MARRYAILSAAIAVAALAPSLAAAQAFTPPRGVGAVTLAWQLIDNTGHRLSDGYFRPGGQSVTASAALDVEYGVTDRLLRVRYMQVGGDLSLNAGLFDLFASYSKYVWGRDAHNGHVLGAGVTWYFGLPE